MCICTDKILFIMNILFIEVPNYPERRNLYVFFGMSFFKHQIWRHISSNFTYHCINILVNCVKEEKLICNIQQKTCIVQRTSNLNIKSEEFITNPYDVSDIYVKRFKTSHFYLKKLEDIYGNR